MLKNQKEQLKMAQVFIPGGFPTVGKISNNNKMR